MAVYNKLYRARVTTRADELNRDTGDRPCEGMLRIKIYLDTGEIVTESYYICESLKIVYEAFFEAIKQAHADGFIPDSALAIWVKPEDTEQIKNADGGSISLVDTNGNLIFSDDKQGISFNCDFNEDGDCVFFVTSYVQVK